MNYHGILKGSLVNGDGVRVVLFVSGCDHHCKGCQNPDTWNTKGGVFFDAVAKAKLFEAVGRKWCDGITFSGGDPLHPENRAEVTELAKELKAAYPNKTIWLYTGFTYEEIKDLEIMKYVDVVVDGPFVESLKDSKYKFAGSTNQRIIKVREMQKNDN